MSVNYGNGINTGLDILDDREKKSFELQEKQVKETKSAVEKLEGIRDGFDKLILDVRDIRSSDSDKMDNATNVEIMLEIQTARDSVLEKVKSRLLNL
ncbi:hypothetical protein C6499_04110 [Candidatus Poribacteria bacterium]|nr:MAG: hypothetical protein C6499_04110 [Candidatus Poribacteria bacterium]